MSLVLTFQLNNIYTKYVSLIPAPTPLHSTWVLNSSINVCMGFGIFTTAIVTIDKLTPTLRLILISIIYITHLSEILQATKIWLPWMNNMKFISFILIFIFEWKLMGSRCMRWYKVTFPQECKINCMNPINTQWAIKINGLEQNIL